jgi:general secretion pathway protein H
MMKKSVGFTLIEILVVLFIMSIVTSVALLSISRHENRQIETFTNELVQRMTLAEEQAILQPVVLGLAIKHKGIQFTSYQPAEGKKEFIWQPMQDKLLTNYSIPSSMELRLVVDGKPVTMLENGKKTSPQIVISTNGDITPFTLYVGRKGKSPRYVIQGDADGNITSKLLT